MDKHGVIAQWGGFPLAIGGAHLQPGPAKKAPWYELEGFIKRNSVKGSGPLWKIEKEIYYKTQGPQPFSLSSLIGRWQHFIGQGEVSMMSVHGDMWQIDSKFLGDLVGQIWVTHVTTQKAPCGTDDISMTSSHS